MKFGFYEKDITPPTGTHIYGYFHERICEGVRDRLFAKAFVAKGDDGCFAIVSIDILSLPKTTGGSFRRRVLGKVNKFTDSFNFDNIIVTATHSHTSGPCNGENELDYEYIESLVDTVAMCIVNAQKQLEDADAFFALGKAEGLAFIRNYIMKDGKIKTNPLGEKNDIVKPYGKTDTSVPMLFIKDKKGNLKGALVGFACHHDCVHGTLSSADYSGILANELKSKYGENFVTVFLNGFCANVNNWDLINIDDIPPVEDYIRIGKALAKTCIENLSDAKKIESENVQAKSENITLKRREINKNLISEAEKLVKRMDKPDKGNIISDPSSIAYKRQTAKELLEIYRDGPTSFEATISVAKIGDCFIVATPGEMFNQYGDMLREKMPTKKIFIAELSNNELIEAYIPVKELLNVESVYETAPNSRRLEDDAGIMMIDKAAEIANTLI